MPPTPRCRGWSPRCGSRSRRRSAGPARSVDPMATSVPTGPIPSSRMAVYTTVASPRPAKASTPPRTAFRQVSQPCSPPAGVVTTLPLARARARRRSMYPVTSMIGRPMSSRTTAPVNTQSGSPSRCTSTDTRPRTPADAAANNSATRTWVVSPDRLLGAAGDRRGGRGRRQAAARRRRRLELAQQLRRALPAVGSALLEAAHEHRVESRGHVRAAPSRSARAPG